jgi:hypothetical protein
MLGSEQQGLNAANGLNAIDGIVRQTAGNKDTIKRLIQARVISEMQGVLAGMRADEISKSGMIGKGNMPSVAEQVLNAKPPPPPAPPPAPPPMLPQGSMPPQMGAPAPQMPMPPQGMASGGLASLPVPDDMFNSSMGDSDTQHYDTGGLVSFADGGGYGNFKNAIIGQESGGDYKAHNTKSGAMGKYQIVPATAASLARRLGLSYRPELMTSDSPEGQKYQEALGEAATKEAWDYGGGDISKAAAYYQGGPNTKGWGKDNAKYRKDIERRMGSLGPNARFTGSDPTSVPDVASVADNFELFQSLLGKRDTKARDAYLAAVGIDPEQSKKDKDRDLGYALLAASQAFNKPGPFLSNLGSALSAMGEPLREGEKSRKAEKLAGLKAAAEIENEDYQDRRSLLAPAATLSAEQLRLREGALTRKQHAGEFTTEMQERRDAAAMQLQNALEIAKIKVNPSDFDTMLQIQLHGTPEEKAAMEAVLKAKAAIAQGGVDPATLNLPPSNANVVHFDNQGNPIQ